MGELYDRISNLCEVKGVSRAKMCREVGIQPSIVTDLKMGRQSGLTARTAQKIASYFGVSVDYLLGMVDKYGLSRDDWKSISRLFADYMRSYGKSLSDVVYGTTISLAKAESFLVNGEPIEPTQLTLMCGMLGVSAPDVFAAYADRLYPSAARRAADEGGILERVSEEERACLHAYRTMTEEQKRTMKDIMKVVIRGIKHDGD